MIFYEFYKIQPKGFTIEDSVLHRGPWEFFISYTYALSSHKRPWKDRNRCKWVLAHGGGPARRNPAAPAEFLVGEGVREEGELTGDQFVAGDWAVAALVRGLGGTVWRRPRAVCAPTKTGVDGATNGRKTEVEIPGGSGVLQWPVVARDRKLVA
jgi:hypothetical protein